MAGKWSIVCRPEGHNPGKRETDDEHNANEGAMIVLLKQPGGQEEEVSRVGFVRRNAKNPDVPFKAQLDAELAKARAAVDVLNNQFADADRVAA